MVATKSVGVRELKLDAPKLVRRASAGERIVITRYGRPAAVLCPLEAGAGSSPTPRARAWEEERAVFERLLPRLQRKFSGRYVAIADAKVVGSDQDPEKLYQRVWKQRGGVFFIGRVGAPNQVVEMPGFEIER